MMYSVRLLNVDEQKKANILYRRVYGKDRSEHNFNWEFNDGPAGKAIYVGAFDGDKLIGTQAAIPLFFRMADGSIVLTSKSEDTLLDPDYRGKGLFEKMYQLLFEECRKIGIVSIWGFTYAKKPFLKLGFQIPFDTESGLLVLKPLLAWKYLVSLNPSNKLKERLSIFVLSVLSWIKYKFKLKKYDYKGFGKGEFKESEFIFRSLTGIERCAVLLQDNAYLNWRIVTNPYPNKYNEVLLFDRNNCVVASIIYNVRPEKVAYIEQMVFHTSVALNAKLAIIEHVIKAISANKSVSMIRFWGFPSNLVNRLEINLLKKTGFLFIKRGTGFVYYKLVETAPEPEGIFLSRLYTQGNI